MKTLHQHLAEHGITAAAFAKRIGVSAVSVHRYIAGDRFPRPQILAAIERETGGAVQANSFFQTEAEAQRAGQAD